MRMKGIEKLQKKHEYISNQITLIKEKRAFDKQAYGDVYNEDTGTFNFQEKNSSLEEEINNENKKLQSLTKELHNIEDKIKKIKPDIEVLQNKMVVDDKNNKNSVKQNELQETNQVSQVNQTTN